MILDLNCSLSSWSPKQTPRQSEDTESDCALMILHLNADVLLAAVSCADGLYAAHAILHSIFFHWLKLKSRVCSLTCIAVKML